MNYLRHRLLAICVILVAALVGSALIADAGDSWIEFLSWAVFLVAINVPFLLTSADSQRKCTAWLYGARRKS